jgi:hypothetical protein
VSGFGGSWSEHPDAIDDHAERAVVDGVLEPGPSSRVIGLGAICDLRTPGLDDEHSQSISVGEFVLLENGRRVILHQDRGFTIGSGVVAVRDYETPDSITQDVLNVVRPDDNDECEDDHPRSWLAELARARGLDVTAEDLEGLPYEVILTDSVTRWLAPS